MNLAPNRKTPLLLGGSNTKNAIVSALSQEALQTAQQLYRMVAKENNKPISYQAMHKALKELEKENVLERHNNQYRLSSQWLRTVENWLAETKNKTMQQAAETQKPETTVFPTIIEFGRFLIYDFFNYPKSDDFPIVCRWHLMYTLIGLSQEEVREARKSFKKNNFVIVCESDSLVDRSHAQTFQKMGVKTKLGIHLNEPFDTIVVGNHVCEIYYDPDYWKKWKKMWHSPKSPDEFDLEGTLRGMHESNPTKAIVYHDPSRAQQIRENVLKEFK